VKHEWTVLGGSGRWAVYVCDRCHRWCVPNTFGGVNWLRLIWPRRFGCR